MTQTFHPKTGDISPGESHTSEGPLDAVLVSDVPVASTSGGEATAPAARNSNPSSAALTTLAQRFDILGELGHGSMGNVYKARDRGSGETVALRLLKPEIAADQTIAVRFRNELLLTRKITHKNVCRVYEFNCINGIAYTSMEFVEGESLRSVLIRFGGLPLRKGIDLALQACSGLKEAHTLGIVHRDLKPENVMIDFQGNVKIMDFGVARPIEAVTRLTGAMVGTPAYMAPEQVAGKGVDYRTDIYSLGLILYEVFTGTQAFHADNPAAVAVKQMRELPLLPHEIEPNIPVSIERAILKCLEKEPAKRFQSIAELEAVFRSPAGSRSPSLAANASRTASGHDMTARQVTVARAPDSLAASPGPRRISPVLRVLLAAFFVLAMFAGWYVIVITQLAKPTAAPAQLGVPKPPGFALEKPVVVRPASQGTLPQQTATADVAKQVPSPVKAAPPRAKVSARPETRPVKKPPARPAMTEKSPA
jgi:serine/threonine protein kinase